MKLAGIREPLIIQSRETVAPLPEATRPSARRQDRCTAAKFFLGSRLIREQAGRGGSRISVDR